jgi:hypothetical protein
LPRWSAVWKPAARLDDDFATAELVSVLVSVERCFVGEADSIKQRSTGASPAVA